MITKIYGHRQQGFIVSSHSQFSRHNAPHTMSPRRVLVFVFAACVCLTHAPSASAGGIWDSDSRTTTTQPDRDPTPVPANAPNCLSCEIIARELTNALYALEGHDVDVEGLTEQELARRGARRRGLMHGGRSELRIETVLGGFCESFANDKTLDGSDRDAYVLPGHCDTLVKTHADTVGDHVFANGPGKMRDFLCVRLARICPKLVGTETREDGNREEL